MKRLFISVAVLVLLVAPQLVMGADVDDLKAADDRAQKLNLSLDPKDIESYVAQFQEEFLYVDSSQAFPVRSTKDQMRQSKRDTIAALESQSYAMEKAMYSVVGNTGIVCHYGTWQQKPKDGPAVTRNVRWTITFAKTGGKWLVHAAHTSILPAGN